MKRKSQNKELTYLLAAFAFVLVLGFSVWAILAKQGNGSWLVTAFEIGTRKLGLVSAMRSDLIVSIEAEKSSVMADPDHESQSFAEQSMRASEAVEKSRREFSSLLDEKKRRDESKAFEQFSGCWERLREIDREILPLAVQNTNLKALRLSFGPAGTAIKNMETALQQLMDAGDSSPDSRKIAGLSYVVMTEALNIYTLQAPHIAETSDSEMDKMEEAMKRHDELASQALNDLKQLPDESGRAFLDAAGTAWDEFRKINAQIIELSRRNSNIRSLAISLGRKRNVTAQCLDSLAALEKVVRESITLRATR